jgi:hypothetical protein
MNNVSDPWILVISFMLFMSVLIMMIMSVCFLS